MSCVYELETGDVVDEVGNIRSGATGNVQIVPPCAYPTLSSSPSSSSTSKVIPPNDNGWMETVGWTAPAAVGEFSATFIVPSGPTRSDGQVVYLFPGMQDSANQNIIQTVLQYGNNARFGGSYWVMASWFGGDAWGGNYYTGTAYRVNVGEELSGSMWGNKSDCSGGCLWTAWMTDSTYNNVSSISVHTNLSWTHVFGGVLEAHVVDSCHDYPSSYESFYDLQILQLVDEHGLDADVVAIRRQDELWRAHERVERLHQPLLLRRFGTNQSTRRPGTGRSSSTAGTSSQALPLRPRALPLRPANHCTKRSVSSSCGYFR